MSGTYFLVSPTVSTPSAACAMTSKSLSGFKLETMPSRTITWSSATRILIFGSFACFDFTVPLISSPAQGREPTCHGFCGPRSSYVRQCVSLFPAWSPDHNVLCEQSNLSWASQLRRHELLRLPAEP